MKHEIRKIALVGQPNVGKSVIFADLTGRYVTVSNYPGTTVEVARGNAKFGDLTCEIIDTPGLYSIFPITEEEKVTLKIIEEGADVIVHVCDAKNLERMLPLTFQLKESGTPIILVLNMFDEADELGISIDTMKLSEKLGIPVIATVAITKQGIEQLRQKIAEQVKKGTGTFFQKKGASPLFSGKLMKEWYKKAQELASYVVRKKERRKGLSKIDKILISPLTGPLVLALVLYFGLYKFVGCFGAGTVVDILEGGFEKYVTPWLTGVSEKFIPWLAVRDLFVGEYGIITLGIRYAIAVILPIVGFFFLVFAVIEDSGYLSRLSFLLDRLFKKIGLSGRAVIPMVLGLGCDTMATMVTRTLPTKRERFIATLLLALCIPCSAQIGVILGLLSAAPKVLVSWFIIIVAIFAIIGAGVAKILPGAEPSFIIEIPPLRLPQMKNVLIKTFTRMEWYFKEIVPLFILASIIIWFLQLTHIFERLTGLMAWPLGLMGLPANAASAFIFGFFRRDYGAAGLYDLHKAGAFTPNQLLIAVVVLTLFLPCITQFLITIRERGLKTGIGISLFVLAFAFLTGVALNGVLNLTGIVL